MSYTMKPIKKTALLNVSIGIMLVGLAISNFDLFGIEIDSIFARTFFIITGTLYVFRFLLKQERQTIDITKMILIVLWSIYSSYILSIFIGYVPHIAALILIGMIWLFQEFIIQVKKPKKNNEFNWLRNVGVSMLIIQFLFNIQQWPFSGPVTLMATAGYFMVGISFIKEFKLKTN